MENQPPSIRSVLPASILLAFVGWVGLFILITTIPPNDWRPLWLFFFMGVLAVTGLALPVIAFLNRRFPINPPATPNIVLRQSIWLGIYFPTLAWLRIGRVLTPLLALLLALGLLLIEGLLRFREHSQWKP
jgi:hypothetical protein